MSRLYATGVSLCGCLQCLRARDVPGELPQELQRMVLCPTCGNKRCPHANRHENACTDSNAPGQPGSAYP